MGEKTDMNRANEVRPMFRRLADVAERTGLTARQLTEVAEEVFSDMSRLIYK